MQRFTSSSAETITLERLGDYVDGVFSGLQRRKTLSHLAAPWEALLAKIDQVEADKKAARRRLSRARVGYWIDDGDFDAGIRALSTETYHLAGKDDQAEPYVSFFGTVTAEEVTDYGEEKATAFGTRTVERGKKLVEIIQSEAARATVQKLLEAIESATAALAAAGDQREDAMTALGVFDITLRQLVRETTALIADTEIGILTTHRGRRDLVDRVLALDFEASKKKKKKDDEPKPT